MDLLAKVFVVLEVVQEPGKSIMKLKALGAGFEDLSAYHIWPELLKHPSSRLQLPT